jgi:tetratricopeptide (TPR) repeat protein
MKTLRLLGVLSSGLLLGTGCATRHASRAPASAPADTDEARLDRAALGLRGPEREASLADLEKLSRELESRVGKNPQDARLHALLARVTFLLHRGDWGREEADRALALAPDLAEPHYIKAFLLGGEDQAEAALTDALRATELEPERGRYWHLLGTLYLQLDRPAEARAAINQTLVLEPRNAQALFLLGLLHMDQGRPQEALDAYEKARAAEPGFALAHYNAGQLRQLRGEPALALECFQKAADLEPQDWKTRAKLVQMHQALGNKKQRDTEREAVLLLHQAGKVDKDYFIRDQFQESGRNVLVVENFELEGDWAKRYEFQVYEPDKEQPAFVVSLGSYAFANAFVKEKDPSAPRVFHLDGYYPGNVHETFGFFQSEPSYDETRELLVSILRGELKPQSSSKPKQ